VRELLGVVPEEALAEMVAAIEHHSAEKALGLVHRFQSEGRNLQHFCREAIRHFRNLLVARVCGADSDLIAATAEQRPELKRAASLFSEEDLTRYFQILLETDDDLRRKPDPRLHLEMGLLRMVNAARLAPLEEVLAELNGESGTLGNSAVQSASSAPRSASSTPAAPRSEAMGAAVSEPLARAATAGATASPSNSTPAITITENSGPSAAASSTIETRESVRVTGIDQTQVGAIKSAILQQQKFLAELVDHAHHWDLVGSELRLYFPAESRALAAMLQERGPLEKLRTIASEVTRSPLRVCVKLDSAPETSSVQGARTSSVARGRYEQDPIVRSMLDRFGGQVSEVKRRGEG
jgi:DNA polymerase-3 subunit gamma/tau